MYKTPEYFIRDYLFYRVKLTEGQQEDFYGMVWLVTPTCDLGPFSSFRYRLAALVF